MSCIRDIYVNFPDGLLEHPVFWLSLFLVAHTKLHNIFQSSTAHQSVYERMLERNSDEIKISECTETFLTLLHAMEGDWIFKNCKK